MAELFAQTDKVLNLGSIEEVARFVSKLMGCAKLTQSFFGGMDIISEHLFKVKQIRHFGLDKRYLLERIQAGDGNTAEIGNPLGKKVRLLEDLIGILIQYQVYLLPLRTAHKPVMLFDLVIEHDRRGNMGIEVVDDTLRRFHVVTDRIWDDLGRCLVGFA